MSIATEIQRLQMAKADIKSAIEQKGVTVGEGTLDTFAEKILEIQGTTSEGAGLPNNITAINGGVWTQETNLGTGTVDVLHGLIFAPSYEYVTLDTTPFQKVSLNTDKWPDGVYILSLDEIEFNTYPIYTLFTLEGRTIIGSFESEDDIAEVGFVVGEKYRITIENAKVVGIEHAIGTSDASGPDVIILTSDALNINSSNNTFVSMFYDAISSSRGYSLCSDGSMTTRVNAETTGQGITAVDDTKFTITTASDCMLGAGVTYSWIAISFQEGVEGDLGNGSGDYEQGYEDGKNSVSNPLEYATELYETYKSAVFPTGYELSLNLPYAITLQNAFQEASGIEKVIIKGNSNGNVINFQAAFRACRSIKVLDLTELNAKIGNAYMFLYYASVLQEVLGELDFSKCTNFSNAFIGCSNLVTFTPKANTIKLSISFAQSNLLSDLSIQSIIDGLADLTGGETKTLTLHDNVAAKLTDEQKTTITAKNWTLVY